MSKSQYYSIGEDPASIRWRQINTEKFQVIYPASFEPKAQRMAAVLEKVYLYAGNTLDHQPRKISVILHTGTVMSNGVVIWAPSRMELFTTPPQETYAQNWLEQLAIHEMRHVVQLDKIETELPKIFKLLLGEQAAGIVIGAYLPLWFLEGDAVAAETALSNSGRGRLPSFEMELKAQVLEKGIYRYDKAYLGSYRDYVPDHYQMGYQMVAGVRSKYGAKTWSDVLHQVARNPLGINSFAKGLKKNTGKNHNGIYNEIFNDLKLKWKHEDHITSKSGRERITLNQNSYTSYRWPYFINDSTIFAVKYSMDDVTRFVLIHPDGTESKIFTPGRVSEESVSAANNKIFWIERKPDKRWANRELSLLRILDLKDGKLFERVFKEKIYTTSLSSDKQFLSSVKIDNENNCAVLLLSPETGRIIKDTPVPDNLLFITPAWAEKENEIYAVALGSKGKSIVKFNPFTTTIEYLLPFTANNLVRPVQRGKYLYFNSSQSGTDNVHAIDLDENKAFRVTTARFGTSDPQLSEDGKSLLYSDYTANGFSIARMSILEEYLITADPSKTSSNEVADKIASQERGVPEMEQIDSTAYQSKPYSKIANLFNFHSWAPVYVDADNEEVRPGISLLSQNKLSTAVTQLGYDYSTINKTGKWFLKFDYSGFYPVVGFDIDYGKGKSQYYSITQHRNQQGQITGTDTSLVDFSFTQLNMNGTVKIPFNLSHGKMLRLVQPEFQIGYTNINLGTSVPEDIFHGTFIPLTYRVFATNYQILSTRDLQPRFGQTLNLLYRHSPFGNISDKTDYGNIWSGEVNLYLPGLVKHHGIRIYGGYQQKSPATRSFSDLIDYPRGYKSIMNNELLTFRTDYVMPLFYPDWSLGKLSYVKRISLRTFYDYGRIRIPANQNSTTFLLDRSSIGGEVMIDLHFLRFIVPSTIGIRQSYLLESKSSNLEVIFSINFNEFK